MDSNDETTLNLQLDPKTILEKNFKTKVRGYDADEVDEFLDQVIKDYEAYAGEVDRLSEENARLRSRVDELTKQLSVSKNVAAANPSQPNTTVTNYDILKRLSNLERHVFGSKLEGASQKPTDTTGIDRY